MLAVIVGDESNRLRMALALALAALAALASYRPLLTALQNTEILFRRGFILFDLGVSLFGLSKFSIRIRDLA